MAGAPRPTTIPLTLLPMAGHTRGKRSPVTCHLKCASACAKELCNTSENSYFRDIVNARLSRRAALGLGLSGAIAVGVTGRGRPAAASGRPESVSTTLPFTPIDPVGYEVDEFTVPAGYAWVPLIRWGDPLFDDSPAFDAMNQTAESQARQFGYNNDYTDILRLDDTHALLFVNHEYTNEGIMFPAAQIENEPERVRAVARAAHGLSVVELERPRVQAPWSVVVGASRNRRFLMDTPYELTGPAAGGELLRTSADPTGTRVLGTIGNCAGGTTPWGTILSGEENFHGYFRASGTSEAERRYGLADEPSVYGWELDEERFDTRNPGYENEANRFGWIVEIDPADPQSTPRKHTALGRFKHEGANVRVDGNGHVAAYMGDDERFDYLYKFVSSGTYREGDRANNMQLLTAGSLYVARFDGNSESEIDGSGEVPSDGRFDGTGEWLPLMVDGESRVEGFTVEEVLVHTRLAADLAGATKMDRCEDVEPNPATGRVYIACTNNSQRGVGDGAAADEANPRADNRDGHIIELIEDGDDVTAEQFSWNILMLAGDVSQGDPVYFSGFPADQVSPISCPDNVAFDSEGNLWISTDGAPDGIGYNDGLFKVTLEGERRGLVEQFLSVPREAETCGPVIHDEERHVFVAVQHPGEDGAFGAQHSYWPDYAREGATGTDGTFHGPRPAVVQVLPATELEDPTTPTPAPTTDPTQEPTSSPTASPTSSPSGSPSASPSASVTPGPGGSTPAPGGGEMPRTGFDPLGGLLTGAAAVAAGLGATFLARRNRGLQDDAGTGDDQ
ncbi:PhoX family phosphatase [Sediminivirga luteola]|nr:PhoX family phosphatase [Sediminivirga luteola]MCI2265061.1 PhoX family phosphatase [Sediminivirga luteola]